MEAVGVASSVDRQSKGGVHLRHTKRRCFSVWLSPGRLTGFTSLKRIANDINGAGQVVGESLVARGGKLPFAGTVPSRFPPEDRTPLEVPGLTLSCVAVHW